MAPSVLTEEQRRKRSIDIVVRRAKGQTWREIGAAWGGLKPGTTFSIWKRATTPPKPPKPRTPRIQGQGPVDAECQVPGLFCLLRERGISDTALAIALGLDNSAVSCWRHAKSSPLLPMLKRLAEHLDVSLDVLVYWRGEGS